MKNMLDKAAYWDKLVNYYYDNVHFDEVPTPSIYDWLKREYKCTTSLYSSQICFSSPEHETLFRLRWS